MTLREIKQASPERFTLIFDDGTELKTTLGIITERFIHSGMDFDEDAYNELVSACTLALSKARALRIINARPMSREELRKRLVEKGETPENAEECAEWLCQMGLINDTEYAGSVVRHYAAKGYGAARIKQELRSFARAVGRGYVSDARAGRISCAISSLMAHRSRQPGAGQEGL